MVGEELLGRALLAEQRVALEQVSQLLALLQVGVAQHSAELVRSFAATAVCLFLVL